MSKEYRQTCPSHLMTNGWLFPRKNNTPRKLSTDEQGLTPIPSLLQGNGIVGGYCMSMIYRPNPLTSVYPRIVGHTSPEINYKSGNKLINNDSALREIACREPDGSECKFQDSYIYLEK